MISTNIRTNLFQLLRIIYNMKYIFENENALELYYVITKEMGIEMNPKGFKDEVYISEDFLNLCLEDIHRIKLYNEKKKKPEQ